MNNVVINFEVKDDALESVLDKYARLGIIEKQVAEDISSHPERTSGVLNRGAYIEVGEGSQYKIHNAFIDATHSLANKRIGSNLVGATIATVADCEILAI